MGEQSPAFQFYVKEWRSSRAVMRMTFAQRGMYLEMLLEQWEHFSLPDDPIEVAHLLGGSEREWIDAWPVLRRKFVDRRAQARDEVSDVNRKRIINLRLEAVRKALRRYRVVARKGGLARAKSANRDNDGTYSPAGEPAGTPAASPAAAPAASQLRTSTASAIAIATAKKEERAFLDPKLDERAAAFIERYPQIYARTRSGASYRVSEARDFDAFVDLVDREPDDRRLDQLCELFLTVKSRDFLNSPGTPRQFVHMFPECDRLLRENGR